MLWAFAEASCLLESIPEIQQSMKLRLVFWYHGDRAVLFCMINVLLLFNRPK